MFVNRTLILQHSRSAMDILRKHTTFFLSLTPLASISIFYQFPYTPCLDHSPKAFKQSALRAAYTTLSFDAILTVSHTTSPRRIGPLYATNLADIEMRIPEQPV